MSQKNAIKKVSSPVTTISLEKDLKNLGLREGDDVIVHSSMNALGWVSGGANAVVESLIRVIGENGHLMMPTHSCGLSDPEYWENPEVPESWWPIIRETMTPYDPETTPTEYMGAIPECFRRYQGVVRSNHPATSFATLGPEAKKIAGSHDLSFSMSQKSPLGELYKRDGKILLLGVGHESNTSLHLAEAMIEKFPSYRQGAPIIQDGKRKWVNFDEHEYDSEDFEELGKKFEYTHQISAGKVGAARSKLIPMRQMVDFALKWMHKNRDLSSL